MTRLFLDADACPVKEEAYRVAARHGWPVLVVSCQRMRDPARPGVELVTVAEGPDLADDWIAERIAPGDICATDDIPLAARCVAAGAVAVTARGRVLDSSNMGEALATRDLMERLRGDMGLIEGEGRGGPPPFTKRDRSRFLERLEEIARRLARSAAVPPA